MTNEEADALIASKEEDIFNLLGNALTLYKATPDEAYLLVDRNGEVRVGFHLSFRRKNPWAEDPKYPYPEFASVFSSAPNEWCIHAAVEQSEGVFLFRQFQYAWALPPCHVRDELKTAQGTVVLGMRLEKLRRVRQEAK